MILFFIHNSNGNTMNIDYSNYYQVMDKTQQIVKVLYYKSLRDFGSMNKPT